MWLRGGSWAASGTGRAPGSMRLCWRRGNGKAATYPRRWVRPSPKNGPRANSYKTVLIPAWAYPFLKSVKASIFLLEKSGRAPQRSLSLKRYASCPTSIHDALGVLHSFIRVYFITFLIIRSVIIIDIMPPSPGYARACEKRVRARPRTLGGMMRRSRASHRCPGAPS